MLAQEDEGADRPRFELRMGQEAAVLLGASPMRSAWSGIFSRASSILLAGSAGVSGSSLLGPSCFLPRSSTVDRSFALRMLDASWSICSNP